MADDGDPETWCANCKAAQPSPEGLRARVEALQRLWQGMEQQALEPPANMSFAQLAHDTWVALRDVLQSPGETER
jgi:hypothetical protein